MNSYIIIIILLVCYIVFLNISMERERRKLISLIFCENAADVDMLSGKKKRKPPRDKRSRRHVFGRVEAGAE